MNFGAWFSNPGQAVQTFLAFVNYLHPELSVFITLVAVLLLGLIAWRMSLKKPVSTFTKEHSDELGKLVELDKPQKAILYCPFTTKVGALWERDILARMYEITVHNIKAIRATAMRMLRLLQERQRCMEETKQNVFPLLDF